MLLRLVASAGHDHPQLIQLQLLLKSIYHHRQYPRFLIEAKGLGSFTFRLAKDEFTPNELVIPTAKS